jgi:AcrR family transcriptional regulator
MPRIAAPTVAEHRARQREALLDAAEELVLAGGFEALTFAALGERTGLARPSLYGYFRSRDDVVVALCERELPRWLDEVGRAMAEAGGVEDRVAAYVERQLELAAAGRHRLGPLLMAAPLGREARDRIRELHQRFAPNLARVLGGGADGDARVMAELVQGVVNAGVSRIEAGDDSGTVIRRAVALVRAGLRAWLGGGTSRARPG